ncbi:MAG: hypothetical protein A3H27_01685 [Acidobacteria bacterium RIFCSPLOWO2_02_FULL_59_13]|nr:MAG: hypothetical protein A3H27_01685 [Acidobacteria bacterium RIFCSPLOWO2_02_FULL_59_13]
MGADGAFATNDLINWTLRTVLNGQVTITMRKDRALATITGIRPDFIRTKEMCRRLDENFRQIMVHTGQHYDDALSRIFFDDLDMYAGPTSPSKRESAAARITSNNPI